MHPLTLGESWGNSRIGIAGSSRRGSRHGLAIHQLVPAAGIPPDWVNASARRSSARVPAAPRRVMGRSVGSPTTLCAIFSVKVGRKVLKPPFRHRTFR
jgi:hypothetical protein